MSNPKGRNLPDVFSIFSAMLAVYCLDIFLFESDLTVLGEAFYSSFLSFIILFLYIQASKSSLSALGISKSVNKFVAGGVLGVSFSLIAFITVLIAECFFFRSFNMQFMPPSLAFALEEGRIPPFFAVVVYILTSLLAVMFKEFFFRGFMLKKLKKVTGFVKANALQALFYVPFGLLLFIRNVAIGSYDAESQKIILLAGVLCLICEIVSAVKWGMLTRVSGSVYMAIFDHFIFAFFANSVFVGAEYSVLYLSVRMIAVQAVSFVFAFVYYKFSMKKILEMKAEKERIKAARKAAKEAKNNLKDKIDGVDKISPTGFKNIADQKKSRINEEILKEKELAESEIQKLSPEEIDAFLKRLSDREAFKNSRDKSTEITEDFDTDEFLKSYRNYDEVEYKHRHRSKSKEKKSSSKAREAFRKQNVQEITPKTVNHPQKSLWQLMTSLGVADDASTNELI